MNFFSMFILCLFWFSQRCLSVSPQIVLYDTRPSSEQPLIKFNCLQYSDLQDWRFVFIIEYCFRPTDTHEQGSREGQLADNYQRFTFQQLSSLNITAENLLQWSTSADLAEDYQYYLNHGSDHMALQKVFRCIPPWFGPRCQYSFNVWYEGTIFENVQRLIKKKLTSRPLHNESYATCYIHLKCHHNGVPICLYWNQICDGRIDCIDGTEDELPCFDLEINECQNDEYRCHNGLCIPQNFVNDQSIECLDQSDAFIGTDSSDKIQDDTKQFVWKEYGCRPDDQNFVCDDVRCGRENGTCQSARHLSINTLITNQGTLTNQCWMIMVCLTKIIDQVDGVRCQSIHINQSIYHCEPLIRFPTKPVLLHHVYFLYHRNDLLIDWAAQVLIPAYICYDMHLCEHLHPTFYHENLSCRTASQMGLNSSSISYSAWLSMIDALRPQFYGCIPFRRNASSSLYCCQNSSKCISPHRIVDGIVDCPNHDDEQAFELSCTIRNQYRFRCDDEKQCRSSLYPSDVCPPRRFQDLKDIPFHEICNRIPQTAPQLIDGFMHSDETECEQWTCNNVYTRCDHYANCPNGEDEIGCTSSSEISRSACPIGTFECVSPFNYTFICLSDNQVADGFMDCLGGADEQTTCRNNIQATVFPGFLCYNQTKCILPGDLCDGSFACPFGDDEVFCKQRTDVCNEDNKDFQTAVEQSLCRVAYGKRRIFSFENLPMDLLSKNTIIEHPIMQPRPLTSRDASISMQSSSANTPHPWYCHDGLAALVRLSPDQYATRCFCPPTFYGDRCQYQNQRVAITLKVYPVNKQGVQSFFISLVSEDGQVEERIDSYHQFNYVVENNCGKTFKFFLLYRMHSKNLSIKYFIKIDAYDQTTLTHLSSWRYLIPFLFLPVNPMAISIRVPAKPFSSRSIRCEFKCEHGRCMKYLNNHEFYCQCDQGWVGKRCERRVDCADCASDSICLGSYENRSICMCPMNRFGRRCLLDYSCEADFGCMHGGKCIIVDPSRSGFGGGCLCPKEYYGLLCQMRKSVLKLSFENVDINPYALVHIFNSEIGHDFRHRSGSLRVLAQKLPMFQKSAIFYTEEILNIVFITLGNRHYLAVLEPTIKMKNITRKITPERECPHFRELGIGPLKDAPEIRRVKYYHRICRLHSHLICFIDEHYFCLCTNERHANCLRMQRDFQCPEDVHCQNGAQCLQENPECPSMTFCICTDCFFGDQCQFYAKGIGLTLDDILRYELRPDINLHNQPISVRISATFAAIVFIAGLINSITALITFRRKQPQRVGTGIYLYASSFTSLMTVTIFNVKFWFLIMTHIRSSISHSNLHAGCIGIELTLKSCLYTDSWLNAFVAIERAVTTHQGINFNRRRSKTVAKWIVLVLPVLVFISLIHELFYRRLYSDEKEKRVWCILQYSTRIHAYNTFILSFHTMVPFLANLISAIFIIARSARRKANTHEGKQLWKHLQKQIKEHRHLIISPIILSILSLPRVIISLLAGCVKVNRSPWLYLSGYFISLIPSVTIFLVFILPSPLYRKELSDASQSFLVILTQKNSPSRPIR